MCVCVFSFFRCDPFIRTVRICYWLRVIHWLLHLISSLTIAMRGTFYSQSDLFFMSYVVNTLLFHFQIVLSIYRMVYGIWFAHRTYAVWCDLSESSLKMFMDLFRFLLRKNDLKNGISRNTKTSRLRMKFIDKTHQKVKNQFRICSTVYTYSIYQIVHFRLVKKKMITHSPQCQLKFPFQFSAAVTIIFFLRFLKKFLLFW